MVHTKQSHTSMLWSSSSHHVPLFGAIALKIIYPDLPYVESLDSAHLELLRVRRERLSKQFFVNMCKSDSKLNYLLEKRNPSTHNTRNPPTYHCPIPKNERYKGSFVIHSLLDLM